MGSSQGELETGTPHNRGDVRRPLCTGQRMSTGMQGPAGLCRLPPPVPPAPCDQVVGPKPAQLHLDCAEPNTQQSWGDAPRPLTPTGALTWHRVGQLLPAAPHIPGPVASVSAMASEG